ncbi:MAG: bifunctional DNA primase/polymerase [Methanothrix sp.]|nr:bifunctional DNA primase/polymerase [Methanothrix sp.]MDI9399201.1 bifunctional DNA primase/polymerase [Euryarchaeota archaeon]
MKTYTGKDPQGKGWADEGGSNYTEDDPKLLEAISKGWNHGLVTGTGGVIVFDGDETVRLEELGVIRKLPETVQVESREGHRHHHFVCPDLKKKFVFYDPIRTRWKLVSKSEGKIKFARSRLHLGEVLGPGGHAVLPGSNHPSGTKYHLVEGCPQEMAEISLDKLKEILRGLEFTADPDKHVTFEEAAKIETPSPLPSRMAKLREFERTAKRDKAKRSTTTSLSDQLDVDAIIAAYGWAPKRTEGDEAKGPAPGHSSESGDCFQINLKTGRWHCKQCDAGGDKASMVGVMEGFISCYGHHDLRETEVFSRVLEACEEKGLIEGMVRPDTEAARDFLVSMVKELKAEPRKLLDPDVLRKLAILQQGDPLEFAILIKKAKLTAMIRKALLERLDEIKSKEVGLDESDEKERKAGISGPSMATKLVNYALDSGAIFWRSEEGEAFVTLPEEGEYIGNYSLKSKHSRNWLSGLLYRIEARTPKGTAVQEALSVLEGMALFGGEVHPVFTRLAEYEGRFYLDLGGDDWRAVEISPDGWQVIPSHEVPVKFRRAKGMLSLPEPETNGNLEDLRHVLNVPDGHPWILVRAWLIQAFRPTGPYPILVVNGEQGSAKSWFGRILRFLLDPNKAPLRRPPKSEQDLMIAAVNSRMVVYDNLSGLPTWLGDAICVLSTGGGLAQRELYTDQEETLLDAQRPVILNGIDSISTRGDLLDRAIVINLPRIKSTERRTEKEIIVELERIRPGIIGAILDIVSHGLKELPKVTLDRKPRLADFAEWIVACEGALPWEAGSFMEAYEENRKQANADLIDNDLFATSLVEFVRGKEDPFDGTASFLLEVLKVRSNVDPRFPPDGWPRSPRGVTGKLKRISPALRAVHIYVNFLKRTGKERKIRIEYVGPATQANMGDFYIGDGQPSQPSPIVTDIKTPSDGCDGDDGHFPTFISQYKEERDRRIGEGEEGEYRLGKQQSQSSQTSTDNGFLVTIGDDCDGYDDVNRPRLGKIDRPLPELRPEVLEAVKRRVARVLELNQCVDPVEIGAYLAQSSSITPTPGTSEIQAALFALGWRPPNGDFVGWVRGEET